MIFVVNSKDRINYATTDSGKFRVSLDIPLAKSNKDTQISLSAVCLPNAFFYIDNSNNSFTIDMQGDDVYTFYITSAYYSLTSLCTALQVALNNFDGAYTDFVVTYSSANENIAITSSANNFKFVNSELAKLFGFYNASSQSYSLSQTSNGSIQFLSTPIFFYLDISECTKGVMDSHGRELSSFVVPLLNNSPNNIDFETNTFIDGNILSHCNTSVHLLNPNSVHSLEFTLYDKNKNVVNLKYSDYYIILSISN